jgi:hypothetical protein
MDIREIEGIKELLDVLNLVKRKVYQFGKLLIKHLHIGISGTERSLPLDIYNELNFRIRKMEELGVKPILIMGDDTDSYLSCYLFNLLRQFDGLEPLTLGGVLVYKGENKGIHIDPTKYRRGTGYVFLDTDIVFPYNSVSLTNHVNLMEDKRILNVNNYLGCNNLDNYMEKYPLGTTQLFLSVCKIKNLEIPKNLYNYFLRCDMSRLPKRVFMSNTLYHFKVLGLDKEFKEHRKMIKKKQVGNYKLFDSITVEDGTISMKNGNFSVIKRLKDWNSPHTDVKLENLVKRYDLDTVTMNVEDDGVLVGKVHSGTFTVYKKRKEYYYTRVIPVK